MRSIQGCLVRLLLICIVLTPVPDRVRSGKDEQRRIERGSKCIELNLDGERLGLTENVSLKKTKVAVVQKVTLTIQITQVSKNKCRRIRLNFVIDYGDIEIAGQCSSGTSAGTGSCLCFFNFTESNECTFLVDCTAELRKISLRHHWNRKKVDTVVAKVSTPSKITGRVRVTYNQINFECRERSVRCDDIKDILDICGFSCGPGSVYPLIACDCYSLTQAKRATESEGTAANEDQTDWPSDWCTTPLGFLRGIIKKLAVGKLSKCSALILSPAFPTHIFDSDPQSNFYGAELFFNESERDAYVESLLLYLADVSCQPVAPYTYECPDTDQTTGNRGRGGGVAGVGGRKRKRKEEEEKGRGGGRRKRRRKEEKRGRRKKEE